MKKIKLFMVLFVALVAIPQISSAYFTTDQKAVVLNSDTLLYTITYKFGMMNYDLKMPIGAVRNLPFGGTSSFLGYTLLKDSETPFENGTTYSIVLSDAKVVNNEYFVSAGKGATFTLLTIVKLPPSVLVEATQKKIGLTLQVTSLPFSMMKGNKETKGKLNPSELQYYHTPEISVP